jgi:hypothetical protein
MSSDSSSATGGGSFWILAGFTGFAVLLALLLNLKSPAATDPAAPARLANQEEILKAQGDLLAKMGLKDDAKRSALFDATLQRLAQRKPASSTQVVPGSPTQLKQAAAAAPAAAPKK